MYLHVIEKLSCHCIVKTFILKSANIDTVFMSPAKAHWASPLRRTLQGSEHLRVQN